jgi:hypothetical protein
MLDARYSMLDPSATRSNDVHSCHPESSIEHRVGGGWAEIRNPKFEIPN